MKSINNEQRMVYCPFKVKIVYVVMVIPIAACQCNKAVMKKTIQGNFKVRFDRLHLGLSMVQCYNNFDVTYQRNIILGA